MGGVYSKVWRYRNSFFAHKHVTKKDVDYFNWNRMKIPNSIVSPITTIQINNINAIPPIPPLAINWLNQLNNAHNLNAFPQLPNSLHSINFDFIKPHHEHKPKDTIQKIIYCINQDKKVFVENLCKMFADECVECGQQFIDI
jgi:hypothetical protein